VSATLGLDHARTLDNERYRVGGRTPRTAIKPASLAEVREVLRACGRDKLCVVPWGGGARLALAEPPERLDVVLDLSGLDRVIAYEPEDLTVTAECGVTLDALRETLAARSQELPLESAHMARATLGGTLAANASGPRRLRFGAPRDRILGARFALADGTLVRSGGQVVKNVAGFALHRLICGSNGALAILLEASLKLMPAPAARVALAYGATREQLADPARWAALPRLEPAYVSVLGPPVTTVPGGQPDPGAPYAVVVGLEDDVARVAQQEHEIAVAWGAPAGRLEANAALEMSQFLMDAEDMAPCRLTFTSSHNTPGTLAPLLGESGRERFVFHALAGRLHWFPEPDAAPETARRIAGQGFTLIGARGVDIEPPVPAQESVQTLRRRIRQALDPGSILALGERWTRGS